MSTVEGGAELQQQRKTASSRAETVRSAVFALELGDDAVANGRFDELEELCDKAAQGVALLDEDDELRVPAETRRLLENGLLADVHEALAYVAKSCDEFGERARCDGAVDAEHSHVRFLVRHLDARFAETHELFLKAYLGLS